MSSLLFLLISAVNVSAEEQILSNSKTANQHEIFLTDFKSAKKMWLMDLENILENVLYLTVDLQ